MFTKHWIALGFVLGVLAGPASAHDSKVGELVIMEPWARATIGQGKSGVAYFTVVNHGASADRLLQVSTPVAGKAHLHTHIMEDDVMKMRPVEAIEIEARGSTVLEPGGLHVMLMGLEAPLKEGDRFPVTLTFEKAGSVEVEVHVQGAVAMQAGGAGQQGHGGQAEATAGHGHGEDQHSKLVRLPSGPNAPTLDFVIAKDSVGGWNLHIEASNFRFAPERANGPHRDGEGHAYLYVNGKKMARVYGPWFHIGSLPSGRNEITVTLNANDHGQLVVGEAALSVTKEVHVH